MKRRTQQQFSPAVIAAFRKLVELEWESEAWWDQHQIIFENTDAHLFEWPCIRHPADEISPRDVGNDLAVKVFQDAQARCRALAKETGINLEGEELIHDA